MSTDITEEKRGISRRDLIKKGAVAGAVVWTVPFIETVPAYAAVGSKPMTCSYITIVYTYTTLINGQPSVVGPVVNKFTGAGTCQGNATSSSPGNTGWCVTCGTDSYDNGGTSNAIRRNGQQLPGGPCPDASNYFNFTGNTITPVPGVTMYLAVAHSGTISGGTTPNLLSSTNVCNTSQLQPDIRVICNPSSPSYASFNCS